MNDINNSEQAENALQIQPASQLAFNQQIEDDIKLAQLMAKAKYALPAHFHNQPAECLAIIQISRLWNMNPYMVAQKTSIINKRLMYEGQLINAAINNSQAMAERLSYTFDGEGDNRQCTVTGRIKGESEPRSVTVGTPRNGQAKNSPLWKGSQHDVDQQLTYKGARVWSRRHAPELTLGIYSPEDEWHESEGEKEKEASQQAVDSRLAILEDNSSEDVTAEDFFKGAPITEDVTIVATVTEDVTPIPSGKIGTDDEALDFSSGREITDNPEDRKPCETCEGTGKLENGDTCGDCWEEPECEFQF